MNEDLLTGEIALIEFIQEMCGEGYVNVLHVDNELKAYKRRTGPPECFYREMKFTDDAVLTLVVGKFDVSDDIGRMYDLSAHKFSIHYGKKGSHPLSFKYLRGECYGVLYKIFTTCEKAVEELNDRRQKQAEKELSKKLWEHNNEHLLSFVQDLREGK